MTDAADAAPWWDALAEHLARRDDDADDPWADVDVPLPALTEAQRDYLAQLADQPPVPRLRGLDGAAPGEAAPGSTTGNPPGEPGQDGGVPSPS